MDSVDKQLNDIVDEWKERLQIKGDVKVTISSDGEYWCWAVSNPPEIHLSLDYDELLVAHELGHLALAQRVDINFGGDFIKADNWKDYRFIVQVAAAQGFKDLFVDDLVLSLKPNILGRHIRADIDSLQEISETPADEWLELDSIGTWRIFGRVALTSAGPQRRGRGEYAAVVSLSAKIRNQVHEALGGHEADKVRMLCDLYRRLPPLPEERFEALSLVEKNTQESARILGFPKPVLIYDEEKDSHYWSR